jgi:hypothetical protein
MRLGSLVCDLLISIIYLRGVSTIKTIIYFIAMQTYKELIIYLVDFLYLQLGLESRACREILYSRCTHIMLIHSRSPPPPSPNATDNSILLCTFYLSTFCLQYFLLLLKSFYSYCRCNRSVDKILHQFLFSS